jgi:hypothetical protein
MLWNCRNGTESRLGNAAKEKFGGMECGVALSISSGPAMCVTAPAARKDAGLSSARSPPRGDQENL